MALTVSRVTRSTFGNKRIVIADVTFDSSYPTGGESLTASDVGLRKIEAVPGSNLAVSSTPAGVLHVIRLHQREVAGVFGARDFGWRYRRDSGHEHDGPVRVHCPPDVHRLLIR